MANPKAAESDSVSPVLLTREELLRTFRVGKEAEVKFRRHPSDPLPHLAFGRRILYPLAEVLAWARRRASRRGRDPDPTTREARPERGFNPR